MHEPCRGQLCFIDRTASNAGASSGSEPGRAGSHEPPPGLFTQPSQQSQELPPALSARVPLDLRKTAAITVAIANVQIRDDEMGGTSQGGELPGAGGSGSLRQPSCPVLARGFSTTSRPLTVDIGPRVPSQDMW